MATALLVKGDNVVRISSVNSWRLAALVVTGVGGVVIVVGALGSRVITPLRGPRTQNPRRRKTASTTRMWMTIWYPRLSEVTGRLASVRATRVASYAEVQ